MLRFRVPVAAWAERLPRSEETNVLILDAFDRASADASVRAQTLRAFVESATTVELLRRASLYAERWGEGDLALEAVGKWREAALQAGDAREIVLAAAAGARRRLESDDPEAAYRLLRETLSAMEERKLPTERSQELLCLVAEEYRRRRLNAMAQGLYSEAVTLSPGYAPAHLGLARTYRDQGDLASASQELERVLQLDSTNEVAARELEQIAKLAAGRR
jgi:tetratricopeptide (TPR) repeat protein